MRASFFPTTTLPWVMFHIKHRVIFVLAAVFVQTSFAYTLLAAPPRVVTDAPVTHSLTAQVMKGIGNPFLLLSQNSNPHNFQLRPSQRKEIQAADLIVWIGPEQTPSLKRTLESAGKAQSSLSLLASDETYLRHFGESTHNDADHNEHDHQGVDPHAWLDPHNAIIWLHAIAKHLSSLDPEHAATYSANAHEGEQQILALDRELHSQLAPLKSKKLVFFHDAYGYFTNHYGLRVIGTTTLGDATSPSAGHLSDLYQTVENNDHFAICLFPETQYDSKLITQLAEKNDIIIGPALDPFGASVPPQDIGSEFYIKLMRTLAQNIASCQAS